MKININLDELEVLKNLEDSKYNKLESSPLVSKEVLASMHNTFDYMSTNSNIHESCLWIESSQNLLNNKNVVNSTRYKSGEIVLVDLGVDTFGYEFCYKHPCVILHNEYSKVFIVPCTSKPGRRDKNGKLYPGQMECKAEKGFDRDTTVLISEAAFVDKVRIISKLGRVDKDLYKEIYNEVFGLIFDNKRYEIKKLEKKLKESQEKYELLEKKLNIIEKENENLREELNAEKLVSVTEVTEDSL